MRVQPMQPVPQVQMQSATVSARQGIRVMPQRRVVHVRPVHVVRLSLVQVIRHVQQQRPVIMRLVQGTQVRPRQMQVRMRRPVRVHRPHVVVVNTVPPVHHHVRTSAPVAMGPVQVPHVRPVVPRGHTVRVGHRHARMLMQVAMRIQRDRHLRVRKVVQQERMVQRLD